MQNLKESDAHASSDALGSTGGTRRKHTVASATAAVGEEDGPQDDEIKQWLVLGHRSELRGEECKGLTFSDSAGEVEVLSKVGNDKLESHEGEQGDIPDESSESSSSSSEDSGTSDDELLMKGSSDLGEVVEWRRPCICCLEDHKSFSFADVRWVPKLLFFVVEIRQLSGGVSSAIEVGLSDMWMG